MNSKLKKLFEKSIEKQDESTFNQAVLLAESLGVSEDEIQKYKDKYQLKSVVREVMEDQKYEFNIDGYYEIKMGHDSVVVETQFPFVVAGEGSGIYNYSDFGMGEQYYLVETYNERKISGEIADVVAGILSSPDVELPNNIDFSVEADAEVDKRTHNGHAWVEIEFFVTRRGL